MIYRDAQDSVALTITDRRAYCGKQIVAGNALDLTRHVRQQYEQTETTPREALMWLADTFGSERAIAAAVVLAEQQTVGWLRERSQERERAERERAEHERQIVERVRPDQPERSRGGFTR